MTCRKLVLVGGAGLMAAACSVLPPVETAREDRAQGEEVSRICIESKATRWSKLDGSSMLLTVGGTDAYKLELEGCKVRRSASSIDLTSNPAGNCLEASVAETTDSCVVRKIYKWNYDAGGPELSTAYNSPRSY
jgi:hypothetical protein